MSKSMGWIAFAASCVAVAAPVTSVAAATLSVNFSRTPASSAVAEVERTFGTDIVLKPGLDVNRPISFSVTNANQALGRLSAVHYLAHALNADVNKVFVVSTGVGAPQLDNNAMVGFARRTMPAADAIRMVAGADKATVNFRSSISGTVTMSRTQLSARRAALEISRQTHTRWMTVYELVPRANRVETADTVIGYTAGGSPITKTPYRPGSRASNSGRYLHTKVRDTPVSDDSAATETAPQPRYQIWDPNARFPQAGFAPDYVTGPNLPYNWPGYAPPYTSGPAYPGIAYPYGSYYQTPGYTTPNGGVVVLPSGGYGNGSPVVVP